jgi:membrane protein implicated in regulation of membrane protease activity
MCCGEAFPRLEFQGVKALIMVGALFLLWRRRRERKKRGKKRKKNRYEREGFPEAGPSLLTVQQVAAVRCN